MAIPAYNGYRNTAAQNAAQSEGSEVMKALQGLFRKNSSYLLYSIVDGTLSKSCAVSALTGAATAVGCNLKNLGTNGCASAHVQGVGTLKHFCVQVNTSTGQTVTGASVGAGKTCGSMGLCI